MAKSAFHYPTDLRAPGAIDDLIAFHHSWAGCARMEGDGADGGGDNGGSGGSGGSGDGGDGGGNDLGFPPDTPVADMTDEQRAAYHRHQREENRKKSREWKAVTGDRTPEQLKQDLEQLQAYRDAEKTPAQKQLEEAEQRGRQAALEESNTKAAKAILRANLTAQGHEDDDIDELVDTLDLRKFIADGDIDTDKLSSFAKKFIPAGTADDQQQRRRDWGGGQRRDGGKPRGAGGAAEAARRFGKKTTTDA